MSLTTLAAVKDWLGITDKAVTGITKANPGIVSCVNHGLPTGKQIVINNVVGMTQINGLTLTITNLTSNTFGTGRDTRTYTDYVSGGTFNADDVLLTRMISAVGAYIENVLNRTITAASYTETLDSNGKQKLMLKNYPVNSITSLVISDVTIPAFSSSTGTGYAYDSNGMLRVYGYAFTLGCQNVVVTYNAGYATVPYDLEQVVISVLSRRYRERDRIGHQSKSIGGETVTFILKDFSAEERTILNAYAKRTTA
jgi:hypothetical protein